MKQTYPNGREVMNAFESDGDLSRIYGKATANSVERTYANSFSYTPDGRIEKLRLGNYRWEWAKFNERLQVTKLNLGSGVQDASLWKLKYEYGEINSNGDVDATKNTGNIARLTTSFSGLSNPFVQSFKYDSLYRLVEAKEKSGANENWKELFSYDRYGNRIGYEKYLNTVQQTLDNKTHPTINPQTNRFNTNQGYIYDLNGNLISDAEGRNFTFNGDNKQSEIRNGTTLLARYFYDGEGKRIKKIVYNPTGTVKEETVFVYDGLGKLIAEYSTATPPPNPTTSYTATDMLGSPRVITNSNGEVVSRRDFLPFGEELANDPNYRTAALKYNTGDSIRQKFTGYQKDEETNLDFAEARMYENRHARFTAVDPLLASGKSANPQTFNRYVYVMNNPLVLTDPTGLQVAQPFCTDCKPGIKKDGDVEELLVVGKDEALPEGFNPITEPRVYNGQSGRSYNLTQTSVQPYAPPEENEDESEPAWTNLKADPTTTLGVAFEVFKNVRRLEYLINKDVLPDATSVNFTAVGFNFQGKYTRDGDILFGAGGDPGALTYSSGGFFKELADVALPDKPAPDLRKAFGKFFSISGSNEYIMSQARNPFSSAPRLTRRDRLGILTGTSIGANVGYKVNVGGDIAFTDRGNYYIQKTGIGTGFSAGATYTGNPRINIPFIRW